MQYTLTIDFLIFMLTCIYCRYGKMIASPLVDRFLYLIYAKLLFLSERLKVVMPGSYVLDSSCFSCGAAVWSGSGWPFSVFSKPGKFCFRSFYRGRVMVWFSRAAESAGFKAPAQEHEYSAPFPGVMPGPLSGVSGVLNRQGPFILLDRHG